MRAVANIMKLTKKKGLHRYTQEALFLCDAGNNLMLLP
jgi:hypothetical protein